MTGGGEGEVIQLLQKHHSLFRMFRMGKVHIEPNIVL